MTSPAAVLTQIVESWNARDRARWMTACAADVRVDSEPAGREGWGTYWDVIQAAFPDNRIEVTSMSVEAALVYFEMTLRGTGTGGSPASEATGRGVNLDFGGIARVAQGRILSLNAGGIVSGLVHQLTRSSELVAVK